MSNKATKNKIKDFIKIVIKSRKHSYVQIFAFEGWFKTFSQLSAGFRPTYSSFFFFPETISQIKHFICTTKRCIISQIISLSYFENVCFAFC